MVGNILRLKKFDSETDEAYWRRKQLRVTATIKKDGRWSTIWADRILKWSDHVKRNTLGFCWSAVIADEFSPEFLIQRRLLHNGRPNTRSISGFSSVRWYKSVSTADRWCELFPLDTSAPS